MPIPKKFVEQFIAKHPEAKIIMLPPDANGEPEEVIAEAYRADDGSSSMAYSLISQSAPHYHAIARETFILMKGALHLHKKSLNNEVESASVLYADEGHYDIICKNTLHFAECVGNPAEVMVVSVPAYNSADCFWPDSELSI